MPYRLYRTPIPEASLTNNSERAQSELSALGLLEGSSAVESISVSPADVTLDLQYRRRYAGRLALELTELLKSQTLQSLPLAPVDGQSEYDGYYAVQSTESSRVASQTDSVVEVNAGLTKEGTRSSQRRAIRCRVTQPDPGNIFGNDLTALVGVPADASRVKWYNREFTTAVAATPASTTQSRFGDVELYDAREVADTLDDDPVLVYQPAGYDEIGDVDVGVWDTYGADDPRDDDGVVQWGRVFDSAHDPRADDRLVVENGVIRLWLDPADGLMADRWRPTADREQTSALYASDDGRGGMLYAGDGRGGSLYPAGRGPWDTVDLPDTTWSLVEVDIVRIGAATVDAQLVFEGDGSDYALDMRLERGRRNPQWIIPESVTDPVPDGLQTLLDPIAAESVYHTGAEAGLVARRDLRE